MKPIRTGLAFIACFAMLNPAMAAESCLSHTDALALKTAAVQQQLMVAAFMCNHVNSYNRFVRAYQPELRASDAVLKSHFIRSAGNETAYDTFKSKVANASALSQTQNNSAFCAASDTLFTAALGSRTSLAVLVAEAPSPPGHREQCIAPVLEANTRQPLRVSEAGSR